jgi:ribosomal protein S13
VVKLALSIYGIGQSTAQRILDKAGIDYNKK